MKLTQYMEKLIQLSLGRVAVITWIEKPTVDYSLVNEYRDILSKRRSYGLNEGQDARLKELQKIECDMGVSVVDVEILSSHPINMNEIKTSFKLSWGELNAINTAINELRKSYKGEKMLLPDAVSFHY